MTRLHSRIVVAVLAALAVAAIPPAMAASKRVTRAGVKVASQTDGASGASSAGTAGGGAAGSGAVAGGGLLANGWLIALGSVVAVGAVTALAVSGSDDRPVSPAS